MRIIDTFLNPNGRLSRARFWLAYISLGLVVAAVTWVALSLQGQVGKTDTRLLILVLFLIPLAWMNLCLMVKRWHDRGRSGLWLLINLIPGIGQMWMVIECGFVAGTSGDNKYGPAPVKYVPRVATGFGGDIPEDMADPSGAVFVTPDLG
jgi:uncharacterized membrane protein YhaH (DUF805 family)